MYCDPLMASPNLCLFQSDRWSVVTMEPQASETRATLGVAVTLVKVASATSAGQVALVLFGTAAVIYSVGHTISKITELAREQRQNPMQ